MSQDQSRSARSATRYGVLFVLGALPASLAPYAAKALGLEVDVPGSVEVVDHVIPGAIVILVGCFAAMAGRLPLPAAGLALLAGLWMSLTHIPLLADARTGLVDWGPALFHSLPAITVFLLAVAAMVFAWRADAETGLANP